MKFNIICFLLFFVIGMIIVLCTQIKRVTPLDKKGFEKVEKMKETTTKDTIIINQSMLNNLQPPSIDGHSSINEFKKYKEENS